MTSNLLDGASIASLGSVPDQGESAERPLVVFGASGHAKVAIEVLRACGMEPRLCLDKAASSGRCLGVPVRNEAAFFAEPGASDWEGFIGVGDNTLRARIAHRCAQAGIGLRSAISPASQHSPSSRIGLGTLVMPGACINADADIGVGVIVNTGAVVEHDCVLGEFVHLAPNATLGGWVQVGDQAMIGLGAAVLPGVRIGAGAVVGAGSVVLGDVPAGATVVGNPARVVRQR